MEAGVRMTLENEVSILTKKIDYIIQQWHLAQSVGKHNKTLFSTLDFDSGDDFVSFNISKKEIEAAVFIFHQNKNNNFDYFSDACRYIFEIGLDSLIPQRRSKKISKELLEK